MNKDLWKSNLPDGILDPRANVIANNKSRANGSDPNWKANTIAKNKELAKDPDWLEANGSKNKELAKDPDWLEANCAGARRRSEYGQWLKENDPEEYKRYFGTVEQHTEKTIKQMKSSATKRWARTMKKVVAEGIEYENHYKAGEALGLHKDTVIYRIRQKSDRWSNWYYIE